MQNQVTSNPVFQFESNEIRIIVIENEPWFVASDICKALNYNTAAEGIRCLDKDELCMHNVHTNAGARKVWLINESGLYALILKSRKPEARKFAKWVTSEVLPTIRKTGSYSVAQKKEEHQNIRELIMEDFYMAIDMFSTLPDAMRLYAHRELIDKTINIYKSRLAVLLSA